MLLKPSEVNEHMSIPRIQVCPPWHVSIHSEYAVQEDNDAKYRRRDEELSVDTQPGKIQPNLLSKVLSAERKALFNKL